jgi:hypothetical protein
MEPPAQTEVVPETVCTTGKATTVGKVAVLVIIGVKLQLEVAIPVIVMVCPLLAVPNAIVLKEALPPTPVTEAVCVPSVPPTV